jgi:hypothetical protein
VITNFGAPQAYGAFEHDIGDADMLQQRNGIVLHIEAGADLADLGVPLVDPNSPALFCQHIAGEESANPAADNLRRASHGSDFQHFLDQMLRPPLIAASSCRRLWNPCSIVIP